MRTVEFITPLAFAVGFSATFVFAPALTAAVAVPFESFASASPSERGLKIFLVQASASAPAFAFAAAHAPTAAAASPPAASAPREIEQITK